MTVWCPSTLIVTRHVVIVAVVVVVVVIFVVVVAMFTVKSPYIVVLCGKNGKTSFAVTFA